MACNCLRSAIAHSCYSATSLVSAGQARIPRPRETEPSVGDNELRDEQLAEAGAAGVRARFAQAKSLEHLIARLDQCEAAHPRRILQAPLL